MTRVTIAPLPQPRSLTDLAGAVGQRLAALAVQLNQAPVGPGQDLPMEGYRITNLSNPAAPRDAINKQYLEQRLNELELAAGGAQGSSTSTTTVVTTMAVQISY